MKTETELKQTWCPWRRGQQFQSERQCIGFACSQCVDCGAKMETSIASVDDRPVGEGWELHGILRSDKKWMRATGETHAYCGRNVGEALRYEIADAIDNINR